MLVQEVRRGQGPTDCARTNHKVARRNQETDTRHQRNRRVVNQGLSEERPGAKVTPSSLLLGTLLRGCCVYGWPSPHLILFSTAPQSTFARNASMYFG